MKMELFPKKINAGHWRTHWKRKSHAEAVASEMFFISFLYFSAIMTSEEKPQGLQPHLSKQDLNNL